MSTLAYRVRQHLFPLLGAIFAVLKRFLMVSVAKYRDVVKNAPLSVFPSSLPYVVETESSFHLRTAPMYRPTMLRIRFQAHRLCSRRKLLQSWGAMTRTTISALSKKKPKTRL